MDNYCNNCGNYGHTYQMCRHPIMSYGIILYHIDDEGIGRIVMVERKDSISYIEFIRGKYKNELNYKYIKLLISRMTQIEKEQLLNHDFDTLWKNLWIHTDNVNKRIQNEYEKSRIIFNRLKEGVSYKDREFSLQSIIMEIKKNNYTMNEWEIPKGRRKLYEDNKSCAIREFLEETNINKNKYTFIENVIPLMEEYKGINHVRYKHVYYIAKTNHLIDLRIDKNNKEQYTEVKHILWLTEEECYQKIRDHDTNKLTIIQTFFDFLKNDLTSVLLI
tara:strand:+ start:507 stop:1331 length:825 start_codon:yes stop_codon:yes gene_type:complete